LVCFVYFCFSPFPPLFAFIFVLFFGSQTQLHKKHNRHHQQQQQQQNTVPSPPSSFHADTQSKSEHVFFCQRFDIPLSFPGTEDDQQQRRRRRTGFQSTFDMVNISNNNTYNNNNDITRLYSPYLSSYHSSSPPTSPSPFPSPTKVTSTSNNCNDGRDGDVLTRFIHPLDPIVIDPTWPSSSVHPRG
jgi:hypothetical protein